MAKASLNIEITDERVEVTAASLGRLNKEQEIQLVWRLADKLPDSYFRDMLQHLKIQFENDTRADYPCVPNLKRIEQQVNELESQKSGLLREVEQLQSDIRSIRMSNAALVANIRSEAKELAEQFERGRRAAQHLLIKADDIMNNTRKEQQ